MFEAKSTTSNGDNMGEFAGRMKMTGDGFTVSSDGCEVVARRRGPYLALSDNNGCGGANVSFSGIHARRP